MNETSMPYKQESLSISFEVRYVDYLISPRRKPGAKYAGVLWRGWRCEMTEVALNGIPRSLTQTWTEYDRGRAQGIKESERQNYKYEEPFTKSFEMAFSVKRADPTTILGPAGQDWSVILGHPTKANTNSGIRRAIFSLLNEHYGMDWLIEVDNPLWLVRYRLRADRTNRLRLVEEASGMASRIWWALGSLAADNVFDENSKKVPSLFWFKEDGPDGWTEAVYPFDIEGPWLRSDGTFKSNALKDRFYADVSQSHRKPDERLFRELEANFHDPDQRRSIENLTILLAQDFEEVRSTGRSVDKNGRLLEATKNAFFQSPSFLNFKLRKLDERVYQVTYTSKVRSPHEEQNIFYSSVWKRNGRHWQMNFHQETLVEDER